MRILETDRLILRHPVLADVDDMAAFYSDPEVRRYFPDGTLTYQETREEVEWYLNGHPRRPELGLWATVEKATGQLIGRCGLLPWTIDGQDEVEVAYLLGRDWWGRGFGSEAAVAIRDHAFWTLGLTRLVCLITEGNEASVHVAEKMGMAFERAGEDEIGPFLLYTMSRPAAPA